MNQTPDQPEQQPAEDAADVTMTDAGEKNPGEDPDFDEEPEVLPSDLDIAGEDASDEPS